MATLGFLRRDFDVFAIEDFSARLAKIDELRDAAPDAARARFQPGIVAQSPHGFLSAFARHMRRAANPPDETWAAFGPSPTGYKRYGYLALCISGVGIHARAVVKSTADHRPEMVRTIKSKSADLERSFRGTKIQQYQNWDGRELPESIAAERRLLRRTRRRAREKVRRHRRRLRMAGARRADCRSRRSARRVSRARTALPLDPLGRVVTARVGDIG